MPHSTTALFKAENSLHLSPGNGHHKFSSVSPFPGRVRPYFCPPTILIALSPYLSSPSLPAGRNRKYLPLIPGYFIFNPTVA